MVEKDFNVDFLLMLTGFSIMETLRLLYHRLKVKH